MRAENTSPSPLMRSSASRPATPSTPSACSRWAISSNCAASQASVGGAPAPSSSRVATKWISRTLSHCGRQSAPAAAACTSAISASVTPCIAETTTICVGSGRARISAATRRMRSAFASEEPPNLWATRSSARGGAWACITAGSSWVRSNAFIGPPSGLRQRRRMRIDRPASRSRMRGPVSTRLSAHGRPHHDRSRGSRERRRQYVAHGASGTDVVGVCQAAGTPRFPGPALRRYGNDARQFIEQDAASPTVERRGPAPLRGECLEMPACAEQPFGYAERTGDPRHFVAQAVDEALLRGARCRRYRRDREFAGVERRVQKLEQFLTQGAAQRAQAARALEQRLARGRRLRDEGKYVYVVEDPAARLVDAARGRFAPEQHAAQQRLSRQRPVGRGAERTLGF